LGYLLAVRVSIHETVKFTITMKSVVKSTLFFAVMLSMAVGCQSKKTESSETATTDTATIVESETVVSGDSAMMMTDTTKVVMPDSTKK